MHTNIPQQQHNFFYGEYFFVGLANVHHITILLKNAQIVIVFHPNNSFFFGIFFSVNVPDTKRLKGCSKRGIGMAVQCEIIQISIKIGKQYYLYPFIFILLKNAVSLNELFFCDIFYDVR